jgi:hypothetical protein
MTMRPTVDAGTTRANLDTAIERSPEYLHPIIEAVRDHSVAMLFVPQGDEAFRIPSRPSKPVIVIVGDDFDKAHGPDGFHLPSIRRMIRGCSSFAVVSSAAQPLVYATVAAVVAAMRQNAMLIETRPQQEIAWVQMIQKLAPGRFIQLATVKGGHA